MPGNLPRPAVVRVATPNGALTADSVISAQAEAGTGDALPVIIAALVLAAVALLAGVDLIARSRRRAPPEPPPHEQPEAPRYEPRPAATASPDPLEHRAWNVPARCEPVIDRQPLLAAIGRTLREGRPVVLAPGEGRAGVGVTTAMIEFAHRNRDDYDIVWWIAAQHPQLVGEQMAQLAEAIGLAAPTDTAGQATAGLLDALGRRGRWLLVFDDAESPYQLARFFPAGSGHVLVASTDPTWGEQAAPLVVPPFTRNQSVQLLRARHTALRPQRGGPRGRATRGPAPDRRYGRGDARRIRDGCARLSPPGLRAPRARRSGRSPSNGSPPTIRPRWPCSRCSPGSAPNRSRCRSSPATRT